MRRARAVVVLRYALAAAIAAIAVPFIAHAAFGDDTLATPTAQVFPTRTGIGVTWNPVDASTYRVERKQAETDWQDASGDLPEATTTWIDESLDAGTSADYRVVAQTSDTETTTSAPVTATRAAQAPVVGDVDVLVVDADPGDGVTWLRNEISDQATASLPEAGSRTLAAGTIKVKIPAFFPGPGQHTVTQGQVELTQGDRSCTPNGYLTVTELTYTPDLQVETMAASLDGWNCAGVEQGLNLEIRINSAKGYRALTVDPYEVNAGGVVSGKTSAPLPVTVKNVGTEPVEIEDIWISSGAHWAWPITSNDCPALLPVAATCTVKVTFTPNFIAFTRAKLIIGDSTSRGWHTASYSGQGTSLPYAIGVTVTPTFTGNAIQWPALATAGGTKVKGYFLHRYKNGIETTQWLDGVGRTTGFFNVSDSSPAAGIEYAVSVVNEVGEGPTGTPTKAGRATEQIAVIGGEQTNRALMTANLLGQVVQYPTGAGATTQNAAVTSSPDGRSLAYATNTGERALWTRRAEPSGLGTPVKLWSSSNDISHLSWSPDGSKIAFQTPGWENEAGLPCVHVISSTGGTPEKIACDLSSPSWMADARTLVVIDGRVEGNYPSVARIEAKPGGTLIKSFNQQTLHGAPIRVSPDGQYVAIGGGGGVGLFGTERDLQSSVDLGSRIKSINWAPDNSQLLALAENGQLSKISVGSGGDLTERPPVTVWPSTPEPAVDVAWQRLGLLIEPTAAVMGPQISIRYDSSTLLPGTTFECSMGTDWYRSCASPATVGVTSSGTYPFKLTATEPDGHQVVAFRTLTVDANGPTARVVSPTFETTTTGAATVQVTATDASGVASYDVRYRRASYLGGFGAYVQPWTGTVATSVSLPVDAGYEYCVSVRAKDKLGNLGAWSGEKCFARPMDDRALAAPTAGWSRTSWSAFYLGTATQSTSYGASLTRTVQGKRFSLVATKCPTCGLVAVYAGGKYIGAVNLASATTQRQAVIPLPAQSSLFAGTLTFTVRSATGKFVQIDGLAVRKS